jgi:hypothetical protein
MSVVDQGCPLLRQKRTLDEGVGMSDLCQKQTSYSFRFCAATGSQLHHSIRHKASCRIHVAEAIVHQGQGQHRGRVMASKKKKKNSKSKT